MPKISVVIPIYNVEKYLPQCIDSVLAQDFQDYEVILVNDGSTDGSLAIAQQYEADHAHIRLISQENKGLGGARNTGIKHAQGEYILFMDSDDRLAPDTLSATAAAAQREESDIVIFDFEYMDEAGHTLCIQPAMETIAGPFDLDSQRSVLFSTPSACNKLFRLSLFTDHQILFPERVWFEDLRTITKLYPYARRMYYLPKPFYKYLQRSESIMHSTRVERNSEIMDALQDVLDYYKAHGYYEQYRPELEYLLIENAFVLASFRVLKQDIHHPLLKQLYDFLKANAPEYNKNPYLSTRLSKKNQIIYHLLTKKKYGFLKLMNRAQNLLRS